MSSTFSANKGYELQATGDNNGTWGVKLDAVLSTIDLNFGGRKNATGLTNVNITVSAADAQNLRHVLSGTLTGNISYTFPNAGGLYFVTNATTGNFTITLASAGGGANYIIPQGATAAIFINPDNNNLEVVTPQIGGNQISVVSVAGGANVTLSATQAVQPVIELTGTITANINVIFPTAGNWIVSNQTTGAFTITCKTASGTGKVVAQGKASDLWADGTNLQFADNDIVTQLGYTPANKAGDTISGALTVSGALTASSTLSVTGTLTGHAITGTTLSGTTLSTSSNATVSGNLATNAITCTTVAATGITGTTIVASTYLNSQPASGGAAIYLTPSGQHQWQLLGNTDSGFYVVDTAVPATRLLIDSTGHATFFSNLTCSGNFNTNAITGTTINGTTITGSAFQCFPGAGGAWYYANCPGVREWQFGVQTDGTFWIFDDTGSAARLVIDTAGTVTVEQSLTVGVNGQVNGNLNCSNQTSSNTMIANSITSNGGLTVGAGGSFGGDLSCAHGVAYTAHGGNTIGFSNSGTNLTFFALGGSSGTWNFTASDERVKENVAPALGTSLTDLQKVALISFDYLPVNGDKNPPRHVDIGLSAQKIQAAIPEAITLVPPRAPDPDRDYKAQPWTDEEMLLSIDTFPLLARCIGAIQELAARVEDLEARLNALAPTPSP